jgi:tetratricopeptide (TPR) repeat protein
LLAAEETAEGLRFRMLETVREFGRRELAQAGEEARARATRRRWAIAYAERHGADMVGVGQFEAIDRLAAEEIDLADELRAAIADGDPATTVRLMAILGGFWAFRGEHGRIGILIDALASALEDWTPPPELGTAARAAVSIALVHAIVAGHPRTAPLRAFLAGLGPGRDSDPRVAALVRVVLVTSPEDPADFMRKLERLAVEPDRHTALTAWQWLSFTRENAGDPAGSLEAAERALALIDPSDGPWSEAILHAQVAQLLMQRGNREVAAHHVRAALPVLRRLGAADDEIQLRSLLLLGALADGRLADAEAELEAMPATDDSQLFGGVAIRQMGRAELALAREDLASGLETYRQCAAGLQGLSFPGVEPTGVEPWLLIAESAALHAHARYAHSDADRAAGRELFSACRRRALDALGAANPLLDLPLAGLVCLALGHWVLRRGGADPPAGVALIAAADALAYNRMIPSMSWEHSVELAETAAPGALAAARERLGGLGPQERLAAARRAVEALA